MKIIVGKDPITVGQKSIENTLNLLSNDTKIKQKITVAVSGGRDSMCLFYLCSTMRNIDLDVVSVNHNIRRKSVKENRLVEKFSNELNVKCITKFVGERPPKNGVEEWARIKRYDILIEHCKKRNSILFLGHHLDDQIETFWLNLKRGSGVLGLAGMKKISERNNCKIVRPLLDISRKDISTIVAKHKIKFIDDRMNFNRKFSRVNIRHNRNKAQRLLGITDDRLKLCVDNLRQTADSISFFVNRLSLDFPLDLYKNSVSFPNKILSEFPQEIILRWLAFNFQSLIGSVYPPKFEKIKRVYLDMISATKSDYFRKRTLGHCSIQLHKNIFKIQYLKNTKE
ncbi:MAG: tRNA lysidine(34) synthetase TilS [Alphaproteobacteria bacterium]|nr:tRNA lysidine(34) synthetase TilS [Alphaproteobacteria bacterium]MBL0717930.1 tRNA lysidine(34) synthetase TilS [Alphaproteobacteria bacterium]